MRFLQVFLFCTFISSVCYAVVDPCISSQEEFKKVYKKIENNAVAKKMLNAYKKTQTYHAVWKSDCPEANMGQFDVDIFFDRKTNNAVFCAVRTTNTQTGEKEKKLAILIIKRNNKLSGYHNIWNSGKPEINEDMKNDSNTITYRDIRRAIFLFYPADLPLFMSEYPFCEILQGAPAFCTTENIDSNNITLKLLCRAELGAFLQIDKKTNLINKYYLFEQDSGQYRSIVFELVKIEIDKPIKEDAFDFDAYLKKYDIKKEECIKRY
jgi:hypothetical protein